MTGKKDKITGSLALVIASFIWGGSYISQSVAGSMGSYAFSGVRSTVTFFILLAAVLVHDKIDGKKYGRGCFEQFAYTFKENKNQLKSGLICGLFLTGGVIFQQIGIDLEGVSTSSGRAGFLTCLYIVMVPLFSVFLKKKIRFKTWAAILISVAGLYVLSVKPGAGFKISTADLALIIGAVFYATQMIIIDRYASETDAFTFVMLEFTVTAAISDILMFAIDNPTFSDLKENVIPIVYSGFFAGFVAYTLQFIGEKKTSAVLASVVTCLETVFAALLDFIIRGNKMTARETFGCLFVFAAIIIVELPERKKTKKPEEKYKKKITENRPGIENG